jgi:hypothetical protein
MNEKKWMLYGLLFAQYISPVQICWYGWVLVFVSVLLICLIFQSCTEYKSYCRKKSTIKNIGG